MQLRLKMNTLSRGLSAAWRFLLHTETMFPRICGFEVAGNKWEWREAGSRYTDPLPRMTLSSKSWLGMEWRNLVPILLSHPLYQRQYPQPHSQCSLPDSSSVSRLDCKNLLTNVSMSLLSHVIQLHRLARVVFLKCKSACWYFFPIVVHCS